jgi:hypothetical protein
MTMETYRNPIARNGDFADPFVLRHDGRYYLYCTNPDIRCWTSSDLVSWTLCGPTIDEDEFPGLVPFAPEVVYADGWFFMYTSPSGQGHHVLRSASPTGPFRTVTGNLGHAIDGNVFIDDDGRWYFYWAGDEGIWGCEMSSPTELGPPVFTGVDMNGWTEGPFVSKRDGCYYMTLTGNHYLSPGYRIDAASSTHPLTGYREDPLNPIVVSTGDGFLGLGHSSSVTGPDLVSTYIVYHNMNPDRSRDLDIDRQVWNGRSVQVLGPTSSAPVPGMADHSCTWSARDAEGWVVPQGELVGVSGAGQLTGDHAHAVWQAAPAGSRFTTEVNLTAAAGVTAYGLSLTGAEHDDRLTMLVDRGTHSIVLRREGPDGTEVLLSSLLEPTFVDDALHCWGVVLGDGRLRLSLDGRLQADIPATVEHRCVVGVVASGGSLRIGSCALTRTVAELADLTAPKPVPGRFWAALSPGVARVTSPSLDVPVDSVLLEPASSATYDLNVQLPGWYVVALSGEFAAGDALAVDLDGHEQSRVHVEHPGHVVSVEVDLTGSRQCLGIRGLEGRPVVSLITTFQRDPSAPATTSGALCGFGKAVLVPGTWDDCTLSATLSLRLDTPDAHGDLIFRATQLSDGGEGDDTRLGIDFFLGYSVQLHRDRVVLARHDYDERALATARLPIDDAVPHVVVVRAQGSILTVDLDGTTVLRFDDPLPHLVGQVGIRAVGAELQVAEALQVTAGGH